MNKLDRVSYLRETLDNLTKIGAVSVFFDSPDGEDRCWSISCSIPDVVLHTMAEIPILRVKLVINFHGQQHSSEAHINLESCRYFVKGQGRSLANMIKLRLAETAFDIS